MVFPQKFGMLCLFLNFVRLALSTAIEIIPLTLLDLMRFVEEIVSGKLSITLWINLKLQIPGVSLNITPFFNTG